MEKNVISYGEFLYTKDIWYKGVCQNKDYPSLEIHEILHLLGLDHEYYYQNGKPSIMNPYVSDNLLDCPQEIRKEITSCLEYIYSNGKFVNLPQEMTVQRGNVASIGLAQIAKPVEQPSVNQ